MVAYLCLLFSQIKTAFVVLPRGAGDRGQTRATHPLLQKIDTCYINFDSIYYAGRQRLLYFSNAAAAAICQLDALTPPTLMIQFLSTPMAPYDLK